MKVPKKVLLAGALLLTGLGTYTLGAAAAGIGGPPVTPAWVQDNGVIDVNKMPVCFERVGPDGQFIKDGNGRPLCIPSKKLFAPPPLDK